MKFRQDESKVSERFFALTESPNLKMPSIELRMLQSRYNFVTQFTEGKDFLEVGAGQCLGASFVAGSAKNAIFVDISIKNLKIARTITKSRIICCAAEMLPLQDASIDVIAALEMVYYLSDFSVFLEECKRILRSEGTIILSMPNPERPGFHRSPFSTRYFDVESCSRFMSELGFDTEIYGVFELSQSLSSRMIRVIFSVMDKVGLVPRTLRGRARLKRLFQGKLQSFTSIEDIESILMPSDQKIERLTRSNKSYSILYVVGVMKQ
jgi:SAM-dependent methyltransferase